MSKQLIGNGTVHKTPEHLRKIISSKTAIQAVWDDITPLARNEWICWIESAKMIETRDRRIRIMFENLVAGKRRSCCWAGCPHR